MGSLLVLASCNPYYFRHRYWANTVECGAFQPSAPPPNFKRPPLPPDAHPLVHHWANKPLGDWPEHAKVREPRIIIARLLLGQNVDSTLAYLRTWRPHGKPGSTGPFNKHGDYDFTEINHAYLLSAPQLDGTLTDDFRQFIADSLIVENGPKPSLRMPGTAKLLYDTENHVLMKEGSRHLKLQWLAKRNSAYDSDYTTHAEILMGLLEEHLCTGSFEFNAVPYMGYTLSALFVLHNGTTHAGVKARAQALLDHLFLAFAYGVYADKHAGPFRRRAERGRRPELDTHPGLAVWRTLQAKYRAEAVTQRLARGADHQALIALVNSYVPGSAVWDAFENPALGYARLGHGPKSSPEIYTRGEGWLLAGGGSFRGRGHQVVPQPLLLLVQDTTRLKAQQLRVPLPEKNFKVNYTGVWKNLAVADQNWIIPARFTVVQTTGNWQLVELTGNQVYAAVYNAEKLGVLVVLNGEASLARSGFAQLVERHPSLRAQGAVSLPFRGDVIGYKVQARRSRWVIKHVNNQAPDRRFWRWPRVAFSPAPEN